MLHVTVTPDAAWLRQPGREFPVVIDPTFNVAPPPGQAQNTTIEADTAGTNYSSDWRLRVGTTASGAVRSLLAFPMPASIPSGTQIDSADLRLYRDQAFGSSPATQTIEVHQPTQSWTASTATWTNASGSGFVGNEGLNQVTVDDTENTSTGTLVDQHTYGYNSDGVKNSDTEKLMSADTSGTYLTHTLTYGNDPRDRVTKVTKDGTTTEQYTHDANDNVTSQTINNATTNFSYDRDRLVSATTGTSTVTYNYDPIGWLDTVTSGTTPLERNTYDGFDNLISHYQATPTATTTNYTFDPLNRITSQTVNNGTPTQFGYLGLSSDLASETNSTGTVNKSYTYTPGGERLFQSTPSSGTTTNAGYYTYNGHDDVEAVTRDSTTPSQNGTTSATYGYTAYGQPDTTQFTGNDKNNAQPGSTTTPFNSYRFNAMRWDSSSGQYDMGFRNYSPAINQFVSRDMYNGALADMTLTTDPFTGNRYTFGAGNPLSNIELDGHMPCIPGGPCGSVQAIGRYEQAAQLNALKDAALNALSTIFKNSQPKTPSLGSIICQALINLCQLPKAIASIPHIPSELKQFGSRWLASWQAGWDNKPIAWRQNGKINVTTPSGAFFQFAGIRGASSGWIPNTSKPVRGEYPDIGQTSLYMIDDPATGQILKFGITNGPAGRYTLREYATWNGEYHGNFQMDILHNFDTRAAANAVEYHIISRVGGPANEEDYKNTQPNDSPWDQVLKDALSDLGDIG